MLSHVSRDAGRGRIFKYYKPVRCFSTVSRFFGEYRYRAVNVSVLDGFGVLLSLVATESFTAGGSRVYSPGG
jgi:hypothetical protein